MFSLCAALVMVSLHPQDPSPSPNGSSPGAGIRRELARSRAQQLRNVEYDVALALEQGSRDDVRGWVEVRFDLTPTEGAEVRDVVLDFAGGPLNEASTPSQINGEDATVHQVDGHLVLPASALRSGTNRFTTFFSTQAAATGWPLTVYKDPTDDQEYFYTLVVPADAHRLFPCFDQPDLKATLQLELSIPETWEAVANGPLQPSDSTDEGAAFPHPSRWMTPDAPAKLARFASKHPISTYLMAFAAGPFAITEDTQPGGVGTNKDAPLRLFHRKSRADDLDATTLFAMHRDCLRWLEEYFGVPYPFEKLDLVLVPGFPYGGMEHAGAIFYRERALVFDAPPTESELTRRSTLIYHELSHQWFGNLVTMEWFDDLWLKEGFATFVAYRCMNVLEPEKRSWLRFHQRVKPRAYEVDATTGTTPVFQQLANLADAKSAYGAIVYNKAPAVLRQLDAQLGEVNFRAGMKAFLERHAYANARWQDLVTALEEAAKIDLNEWSSGWILAPGMPQVQVRWTIDENGRVSSASIHQQGVHAIDGGQGDGPREHWPLQLELLVWEADGTRRTVTATTEGSETMLPVMMNRPAPHCVLLNPKDQAYGQFLVDATSRNYLLEHVADETDPLVRAVALSALWDTVREAAMDPIRFANLGVELLQDEKDPETHGWLLARMSTCLGRYLAPERAAPLREALSRILMDQLRAGMGPLAQQTFRFLARHGIGNDVDGLCRAMAQGAPPEGVPEASLSCGKRDRFLASARSLARGDGGPLAALVGELESEDTAKDAYLAGAAGGTGDTKAQYFASYLELTKPPEQWMQDSLSFFHWPGQSELTLPFLDKALAQLEWVKEHRKIFFMPAWIDGFVNGHSSQAALDIVDARLADETLPADIRNKILQSVDGLRRAVRIRARW